METDRDKIIAIITDTLEDSACKRGIPKRVFRKDKEMDATAIYERLLAFDCLKNRS